MKKKKNEKYYLDDDVQYLMDNKFKDAEIENKKLKNLLIKKRKGYNLSIKEQEDEYKKHLEEQVEAYKKEFGYSLKMDPSQVYKILEKENKGVTKTSEKLDEKLKYLNSKNNNSDINKINEEIKKLEAEIANIKNN